MLDRAITATPTESNLPSLAGGTGDETAANAVTLPMQKWGSALDGGFQLVPDLLLRHQRELKLTSSDLVVLLHLTMAWWERDRHPYPRTSTIARRMNTSERTVQRSIERLRKSKLLHKTTAKLADPEKRPAFDLSPLAERLQNIARTDPIAERRLKLRTGEAGLQAQPPAQAQ